MEALVLTNCTKAKRVDWTAVRKALEEAGLPTPGFDVEREDEYRRALARFIKPAVEMYGGSFEPVKKAVERLRRCGLEVELYIISARYGPIKGDEPIIPYEATLSGLRASELEAWAEAKKVREKVLELADRFDYVLLALTGNYARALGPALEGLLSRRGVYALLPGSLAKGNAIPSRGLFARGRQMAELAEALCADVRRGDA